LILHPSPSLINATEHFGEAVYSHDMFRMGRPELCSRMCRGGTDSDEANTADLRSGARVTGNGITDSFLMPGALGNTLYPMAAGAAASLSSLQGVMNPATMANRSNMVNMGNFPIPMSNGMSSRFAGAHGLAAAGMVNSANPFAFSQLSAHQTMYDMQIKQLAQANLNQLKQYQLLQGGAVSPSLMQQQGLANSDIQQQIVSNMMSRRHSLMTPNDQLHQPQVGMPALNDSNLAMLNRRNSAPASQLQQNGLGQQDITKMSILEVEEELLRVKEMKLMMMKRKLETQLETTKEQE
jgi:hypothetical protein